MNPQSTSACGCSASVEITALLAQLQALDGELVEHRRHLAYALDDLGATLEQARQIRQQLVDLMTPGGAR